MKVTVTLPIESLTAFIASLDMAIALCDQRVTHFNAADHLRVLREALMKMYVDNGEPNETDTVS